MVGHLIGWRWPTHSASIGVLHLMPCTSFPPVKFGWWREIQGTKKNMKTNGGNELIPLFTGLIYPKSLSLKHQQEQLGVYNLAWFLNPAKILSWPQFQAWYLSPKRIQTSNLGGKLFWNRKVASNRIYHHHSRDDPSILTFSDIPLDWGYLGWTMQFSVE